MLKLCRIAVPLVIILGLVEMGWAADAGPEMYGKPNPRLQLQLNQRIDAVYKDMLLAEVTADLNTRVNMWIYLQVTGQSPRVSLDLKQATVHEVLIEIARQCDLQLVCNRGLVSLAQRAPKEKLQALGERLKHADPLERCGAIYQLGQMQDSDALKLITEAFTDPHPDVRDEVLNAVQRKSFYVHYTGSSDAVAQAIAVYLKENGAPKKVDHRIYPLLATLGPRVDPLLDLLDITSDNTYQLAHGLATTGSEKAVRLLCESLAKAPQNYAHNIISALGETGTPAALAALQDALRRPNAGMLRASLLRSIAAIGSDEALAAIKAELPECDSATKSQFVDTLAYVPSKSADALLAALAEEKDAAVSVAAAFALCRRGHPLGAATLPLGLEKLEATARMTMLQSKLYFITDPAVYKELANSDDAKVRAIAHIMIACLTKDPSLVPAALDHFAKLKSENRYSVIHQLARLTDPRVEQFFLNELKQPPDPAQAWNSYGYYVFSDASLETVFELMQSDKPALRNAAVSALSRSTTPRAVALLLQALAKEYNDQDQAQSTHTRLIGALTPHAAKPEVYTALLPLARKPGPIGKAAGAVIAHSDDPGPLLPLAASADPKLRAHAAVVLSTTEPRQRQLVFQLLVDDDATVRAAAGTRMYDFYNRRNEKLAALLPRMVKDSEVSIRSSAAMLLNREPAGIAVPLLLELSEKADESGKAAIRTLPMFDDPRVIARLMEMATPDHPMRHEASSALYGVMHRFKLDPEKKAEIEQRIKAIQGNFRQPVPPPQPPPKEPGQTGDF